MQKFFYFTFQETPESGIFQTQVIDVVKHWQKQFGDSADINLISLIPIRGFWGYRRQILASLPNAIVLPQLPIPRMYLWYFNTLIIVFFCLFTRPDVFIGRSIFATYIAIKVRKLRLIRKVIFDSRGIINEEAREYGIYPLHIKPIIREIEQYCTVFSDFIMVITKPMIDYFRKNYAYTSSQFEIIPCTLGLEYKDMRLSDMDSDIISLRSKLGYSENDCVLVYSGSNAGWQSFDLMLEKAIQFLDNDKSVKLLLMTRKNSLVESVLRLYPERVQCLWVKSEDVNKFLKVCDYGLMIRENSKTNNVSSPTKFAEYLASGLPVIATNTMAITEFIKDNSCGIVLDISDKTHSLPPLKHLGVLEKKRIISISQSFFSKDSHIIQTKYNTVFQSIKNQF